MRLSISITSYTGPIESLVRDLTDVARHADDAGIDTVWVADHLLQAAPGTQVDEPMLEAYTTLGYLAAVTTRVRLGTMVTGVTFRPPAVLIKAVTTLDVLSGGRAWLGLGAGYHQAEADMMGLPLPPTAERFEQLEETLRLAGQMWAGNDSSFEGRHFTLQQPVSSPAPVQRPHPPILVGGAGEKRTLRLVAQYADACNLFDIPDGGATLRHKLGTLADHCTAVGRQYHDIEKTVSTRLEPDEQPAAFVTRCEQFAQLGLEHAVVITSGAWDTDSVARLGAAVPLVRDLPARVAG